MGMSFDKAVDRLEDLHFEQDNWEYEELTEDCLLNRDALRLAIDTMRKYQRIQEIVKEWREIGLEYDSCDAMMNIERVLEDEVN